MAYINITGDSDGDLHTAALHNAKFGALASVLNGNIDSDNLKNPLSMFSLTFAARSGAAAVDKGWINLGSLTNSTIAAIQSSGSASAVNMMQESLLKVPVGCTFVSGNVQFVKRNAGASGDNYNFYLQSSSTVSGTFGTTIASATNVDLFGSGYSFADAVLTAGSVSITGGHYIRLVVENPGSNPTHPAMCQVVINFKTNHVA